jgi:UDP-3-O-[3-hydroxymyristoyl] glucosamine N-acyltransferase
MFDLAVFLAVATIDKISFASDNNDSSFLDGIKPVAIINSNQKTDSSASSTTVLIFDRNSARFLATQAAL